MENPANPFKNANICTHCGYCLPVCPTYRIDNDETESPRGRVAIVLALASGTLTPEEASIALSRCLLCRACHTVCPAGVRPAKLTLLARNLTPLQPLLIIRLLHWITSSHRLTAMAARLIAFYQTSGLQQWIRHLWILPRLPYLARLEALLPASRPNDPIPDFQRSVSRTDDPTLAANPDMPRVGLLCGCMARLFYPGVAPSTANLLTQTQTRVTLLHGFGCCGAPFRESGNRKKFLHQARRTLDAFMAASPLDAVVCDSAICLVTVQSYARSLADDPHYAAPAREFSEKVIDFNTFLLKRLALHPIPFGFPGLDHVAYHDHCQTRFGLGIINEPRKLLDALPVNRREIVPPGTTAACCGAGGDYLLREPKRSQDVRTHKLQAIVASGADTVAASNPGCMLHLEAGLRQTGSSIQVRHLAELLWTAFLRSATIHQTKPSEPSDDSFCSSTTINHEGIK
ncbi:MAG: (Fe-S)-binding protein [Magnetococcus sp. YQC-5]